MNKASENRFAVFGNPVSHSKSPGIHQLFAEQFGLAIDYQAIEAPVDGFRDAVMAFRDAGGKGCNVTVPFKQEAWELADHKSGRAELAGAVNTLKFEADGSLVGENTDGVGLLRDLTLNLDTKLYDQRILVIGAGGAVRGILGPLIEQAPKKLIVANRTVEKAVELARLFSTIGPIEPSGFEQLSGQKFDVVINGTAASLAGEIPPIPTDCFAEGALAYDLMYSDKPTPFMDWAAEHGAARVSDGLGMLVEQAAESFRIWLDLKPDTGPVIRTLR
jgi:shikimate dehydrogenase